MMRSTCSSESCSTRTLETSGIWVCAWAVVIKQKSPASNMRYRIIDLLASGMLCNVRMGQRYIFFALPEAPRIGKSLCSIRFRYSENWAKVWLAFSIQSFKTPAQTYKDTPCPMPTAAHTRFRPGLHIHRADAQTRSSAGPSVGAHRPYRLAAYRRCC